MSGFLQATLTGLAIGGVVALAFWLITLWRLDRFNQGLIGSAGLVGLIAVCLWLDGWIAAAILGFVAAMVALIQLQICLPALGRRP